MDAYSEKNIKEYIRALDHMKSFFQDLLENDKKIIDPPSDYVKALTNVRMLTKTPGWPAAIDPEWICGDDENSKMSRASGVIDKFFKAEDLSGKKFLDFGCGEGHVAYVAATLHDAELAIGYDPKSSSCKSYEKTKPNFFLTDNFDEVALNSNYDFILLNDVLDHSSDPLLVLEQVKNIKSENCRIAVRCHPWTSRHGTHLYKQRNKAFLHLVFTKDEIFAMGLKEEFAQQVLDPLTFYRDLIKQTGLKIIKEDITTCPVEIFFTQNEEIMRRIKEKWKTSLDPELKDGTKFPRDVLEIEFVDYWLE